MMVTGDTLPNIGEEPKEKDTLGIETYWQKGLLPDRTLESFERGTEGATPIDRIP
jgi:hypothetical protein